MLKTKLTSEFRRDIKRLERSGADIEAFRHLFDLIASGRPLPDKCHDHALTGNWRGHRELHIKSDWLLIYQIVEDTVYFVTTGSHSHLFKK